MSLITVQGDPEGGCGTHHQGLDRVRYEEPHCATYYVGHKDGKSMYVEPTVRATRVSPSEKQQYISWTKRFAAINAVDSPATNEDIDHRSAGYEIKIGVASPTR